mgnify:CR=1 FL=1
MLSELKEKMARELHKFDVQVSREHHNDPEWENAQLKKRA